MATRARLAAPTERSCELGSGEAISIPTGELAGGEVRFRFWNPFHAAVRVATESGTEVATVRFVVERSVFEVQSQGAFREVRFRPPFLRLVGSVLLYSACASGFLVNLIALVGRLTSARRRVREVSRPAPREPSGRAEATPIPRAPLDQDSGGRAPDCVPI